VLEEVGTYEHGQFIARTAVLSSASLLTLDDLRALLRV
jgi:hypothetical protein